MCRQVRDIRWRLQLLKSLATQLDSSNRWHSLLSSLLSPLLLHTLSIASHSLGMSSMVSSQLTPHWASHCHGQYSKVGDTKYISSLSFTSSQGVQQTSTSSCKVKLKVLYNYVRVGSQERLQRL